MRIKRTALLLFASLLASGAQNWTPAQPGYRFRFPRDHFSHPEFQTEWWYFTGNLESKDGHRFGYELTFFRQGSRIDDLSETATIWKADEIYLAHLALTDVNGKRFFHTQRLNRAGPGLAGAGQQDSRYWNGNWQVRWLAPGRSDVMRLQAITDDLRLSLDLTPAKPAVVHGHDGVSRKGPDNGEASHYISFTRIQSQGQLTWQNQTYSVSGQSWMDHEFFSEPPDNGLLGWDWFSIQLENNTELMLYRLRRDDGSRDFSSGTFIDEKGAAHHLEASDFHLSPRDAWHAYPVAWQISVPSLGLELNQTTPIPSQEMASKDSVSPTYWEGAVDYHGTFHGQPMKGRGYLEMTGYGSRMRLGTR